MRILPIVFSSAISKNYAWELSLINPIRSVEDGVTGLEVVLNYDRYKGDHNPKFEFKVTLLNVMLVEFNVYNRNHEVQEDEIPNNPGSGPGSL